MKKTRFLSRALLGLTCLGTVGLPAGAAEKTAPAKTVAPRSLVNDIALTPEGALKGKVVDSQGRVMDGASVVVRQGNREIARTMTDKDGGFDVKNVRGGVYQISSGKGVGTYRVWTANAAPPSARPNALVVSSPEVVRGQIGGAGLAGGLGAAAGGAGLVAGGYSVVKTNSQQDDIDEQEQQNQLLQQQINKLKSTNN